MKRLYSDELLPTIRRMEGSVMRNGRHVVYDDATGKPLEPGDTVVGHPTIGYGRNVQDRGIANSTAEYMLFIDVMETYQFLRDVLPWFEYQPEGIREVLINMAFQMGPWGLMDFRKTLSYMERGLYSEASVEMLDSEWARQTPDRAIELSQVVDSFGDSNQSVAD